MIQTNCKRFCSFVGPYINSCGASSDSPRPLAEDPAPRSARRSPAGRGRRAGTRIGAGRGRPSRTLGCRGRRLELPPRPPALPSVAQVGRTAKPARPPARLSCRLSSAGYAIRPTQAAGTASVRWRRIGGPLAAGRECGSRLPGHWQAAGPAGPGPASALPGTSCGPSCGGSSARPFDGLRAPASGTQGAITNPRAPDPHWQSFSAPLVAALRAAAGDRESVTAVPLEYDPLLELGAAAAPAQFCATPPGVTAPGPRLRGQQNAALRRWATAARAAAGARLVTRSTRTLSARNFAPPPSAAQAGDLSNRRF